MKIIFGKLLHPQVSKLVEAFNKISFRNEMNGQGHLTLAKGHSDFKTKTFFSETVGPFEIKFHMKAYGRKNELKLIQLSWVNAKHGHHTHL